MILLNVLDLASSGRVETTHERLNLLDLVSTSSVQINDGVVVGLVQMIWLECCTLNEIRAVMNASDGNWAFLKADMEPIVSSRKQLPLV